MTHVMAKQNVAQGPNPYPECVSVCVCVIVRYAVMRKKDTHL